MTASYFPDSSPSGQSAQDTGTRSASSPSDWASATAMSASSPITVLLSVANMARGADPGAMATVSLPSFLMSAGRILVAAATGSAARRFCSGDRLNPCVDTVSAAAVLPGSEQPVSSSPRAAAPRISPVVVFWFMRFPRIGC